MLLLQLFFTRAYHRNQLHQEKSVVSQVQGLCHFSECGWMVACCSGCSCLAASSCMSSTGAGTGHVLATMVLVQVDPHSYRMVGGMHSRSAHHVASYRLWTGTYSLHICVVLHSCG